MLAGLFSSAGNSFFGSEGEKGSPRGREFLEDEGRSFHRSQEETELISPALSVLKGNYRTTREFLR